MNLEITLGAKKFNSEGFGLNDHLPLRIGDPVKNAVQENGFFTVDAEGNLIQQTISEGVTEGDTYTDGIANAIPYLNGDSEWTSSPNLTYNGSLYVSGGVSGSGGGRQKVVTYSAALPEVLLVDPSTQGFAYSVYGGNLYFRHTDTSGNYISNLGLVQLSTGKWTIGNGTNPTGQLDVNVQTSTIVGQRISLANLQSANAFEINSYGGSGGNVLKVTANGGITTNSTDAISGGWSYGVNITGGAPTVRLTDSSHGFGFFKDGVVAYIAETSDGWASNSTIGAFRGGNFGMGTTNPSTRIHGVGGVQGSIGGPTSQRVAVFEGNLPEILLADTSDNSGFAIAGYGNNTYLVNTNSSGVYQNYVGLIQMSSGAWTISSGSNPLAALYVKNSNQLVSIMADIQLSTQVGFKIKAANSQSANLIEINSFSGSGGDLFRILSGGEIIAPNIKTTRPTTVGEFYQDTAANIAANGDLVVGIRQ